MKISIIIPIYNVEKYLEKCLKSVIKQNLEDTEILLINDGSTDNSKKICDKYLENNTSFKYYEKKNGGLSDARNYGINKAIGDYIVFLDGDDELTKNSISNIKNDIKFNPDIMIQNFYYKDDNTDEIYNSEFIFKENYGIQNDNIKFYKALIESKGYIPTAWNVVIKRDYLLKNELYFFKGILHEDEEWSPRVILNTNRIMISDKVNYIYRTNRKNSIMNNKNNKSFEDCFVIIDQLLDFAKKKMELREVLYLRCSQIFTNVIINGKKNESINKKIKEYSYILKHSKKMKYLLEYIFIKLIF